MASPISGSSSLVLSLAQLSKDPFTSLLGHPASPLLLKRRFDALVRRTYLEELTSCGARVMPFHYLARRLPRDVFRPLVEVWGNIKRRILAVLFMGRLFMYWIYNGLAEDDFVLLLLR